MKECKRLIVVNEDHSVSICPHCDTEESWGFMPLGEVTNCEKCGRKYKITENTQVDWE